MSQDAVSQLSPLKQAYLAVEKMQAKLEAMEQARREPIAIIGVGCRFPGSVNNLETYWQLLQAGVDAVGEVPADRWDIEAYYDPDPDAPGKMYTRRGAFLDQIDQFDPQFFGIAPREAVSMDPQQRLLLEVTWEALEHAGQAPDKLTGSRTGVFIGINNTDYRQLQLETSGITQIDTYYSSGVAMSIASGRLSYVLGLQGPSISVDTACSSSLVAVHLACQSLLSGECRMALAGGVNLILTPELYVAFSKYQMLSADGHCKAFDAQADGFSRGEGCGIIVLKRLSDALTDGDNVLAVIKGSAVNQDGASSGLTAPNGPSQENVIRDALTKAGLKPAEVAYVEAHGTGTSLGDPIEVQALGAALGEGRSPDRPLAIGSVKTNIGHLEAAAGIAGLIKVVLMLQHQQIPPHLHLQELSPFIPWQNLTITVPTQLIPWPKETALIAGVSSFGFSGTNTHIILAAAPTLVATQKETVQERPVHLLNLSAKGEQALTDLAGRFYDYLTAHPETPLADLCFTANVGRAHLNQRLAIVSSSTEEMHKKLGQFMQDQRPPGVISGAVKNTDRPKIAFLFTGQGSQYVNMGRQLYQTQPAFRQTLDRCNKILQSHLDVSLLSILYPVLYPVDTKSIIDETAYTQPALFALEYALAELWRSWGVEPTAVMGHSVGEYVAACLAGVFSLEDGLKLIAERGRLMQALPSGGTMVAVFASEAQVAAAIKPYAAKVAMAAVNGPENIVISGEETVIQIILQTLESEGIKARRLTVSHAFHSPLMEPMLDAFERVAAEVTYAAPRIKLVSNVTGQLAMGATVTQPAYWRRHVRETVQFAAAMHTLQAQGVELFLEIGPNPVLVGMGQRCLENTGLWLPSLRSGKEDWPQLLQSLAELYVYGAEVDWNGFERDFSAGRTRLALPTYPFQRKRYWIQPGTGPKMPSSRSTATVHPLLGQRLRSALKAIQFEGQISAASLSFLNDHRVYGKAVMPATGYIETALAAATEVFGPGPHTLEDLLIQEPFIVGDDELRTVQVIVTPETPQRASLQIFSQGASEDSWQIHASGSIGTGSEVAKSASISPQEVQANCTEKASAEAHYDMLRARGLEFGPSLQGVQQIWQNTGQREALGQIRLPEMLEAEAKQYQIHPALLDACFQILAAALSADSSETDLYMPVGLDSFHIYEQPGSQLWSYVKIESEMGFEQQNGKPRETFSGVIRLLNETGQIIAEATGLRLKRASQTALLRTTQADLSNWLYQVEWQTQPLTEASPVASTDLPPIPWPAPAEIAAQVQPQFDPLSHKYGLEVYRELGPQMDRLSADYIVQAWQQLGWQAQPGERFTSAGLAEQLGIIPLYHRLLDRMIEILAEDGLLSRADSAWEVGQMLAPVAGDILHNRQEELVAQYPAFEAELTFIGRCGPHLAEVLQGRLDPLQLLFPGSSLTTAEKLYQASPFALAYNGLVQMAVAAALKHLPTGNKLRVLEIGGGTGGTTSYVLPKLPADQTEYTFTDVSPLFTAKAAQKFSNYSFVRYQTLDIEQEPLAQGFVAHQFDLIVAANVIHATNDLEQTLSRVQQLLAPEGLLLLLEMTRPERWVDLTFGLTEGWWKFTDTDLRTDSPLLSSDKWLRLLDKIGFTAVAAVPEQSDDQPAEQAIVLARGPHSQVLPENWLIFADENGIGQKLAQLIESRSGRCVLVSPGSSYEHAQANHFYIDPARGEDYVRMLNEALAEKTTGWHGIVHMWSVNDAAQAELEPSALAAAQRLNCGSVLHLVQALSGLNSVTSPRLWLVTRGAQPVGPELSPLAMAQSPLWGLGKVIALEQPELHCVRIDLDPASTADNSQHLWQELGANDEENQVAFRNQQRYAARLAQYKPETGAALTQFPAETQPVRLDISVRGALDNLTWQPVIRRQPGPGEVEVRVRATGLNFKDVLNALGMYPGDAGLLGSECAGEVVAVGSDVTTLKVGDAVMLIAPGSFSTFVTTGVDSVVRKPVKLSFEEAATIPIPFITAYYTLHHLGKMSAGERVLIHAAAGGVGLAAVRLAQRAGAEIFGTAGSPEKRAFLKSLGVQHVFDSRTLDFADEIMTITGGRGVDLVLNSLADDFVGQSVAVLAPQGRFLEIGKRGILTENQMTELRPDVAYFIVDWGETQRQDPALIRSIFEQIMAGIEDGTLESLPYRSFPVEELIGAFRYMAQAKHIGKVVVSQGTAAGAAIRPDGTYLITGGLSGLGLRVAGWLVERGARHLALIGRRKASEAAQETIRALEQQGARIMVAQADVSVEEQIAGVLAEIEVTMPRLRGIIHSAGVLDDGVLLHQDWTRFATVMAPKVEGSWHLHRLTQHLPLDFFVLFSSAASLLGSRGQSNHAAANMFLDMLAHHRRAQGLPGLSLNWGAWTEIGAAVKHNVFERINLQGIGAIAPEQGLQLLAQLLEQAPAQVGIMPITWPVFMGQFKAGRIPTFFANMTPQEKMGATVAKLSTPEQADILRQLAEAPLNKRRLLLLGYVQEQTCKVLGLDSVQAVGERVPLNELGLDSLMAVELRNLLGGNLKLKKALPATLVFDYPTVEAMTDYLAKELSLLEPETKTEDHQETVSQPEGDKGILNTLNSLEELSDEEVDQLFAQQMQHLENWGLTDE